MESMQLTVLGVRRYKAGYEVRTELVNGENFGSRDFEMKSAYTLSGDYIGSPKDAYRLCRKRGIKPEKITPGSNVCSIGFSENNNKWYGWSHRAIYGFAVGDTVKEGDCTASSGWAKEWLADHPEDDLSLPVGFTANSMEDAKRMAIAFAESVG